MKDSNRMNEAEANMKVLRVVAIAILLLDWAALADDVRTTPKKITTAKDKVAAIDREERVERLREDLKSRQPRLA